LAMSAEPIDPEHSVVVWARFTLCQDGKVDGAVFTRRIDDDDGLSVNWLECFAGSRAEQIAQVSTLARLTLKASGRYAEVQVKEASEAVAKHLSSFGAVKDPLPAKVPHAADPSHSLFLGLPEFGHELAQMVGDMIAARVCALHPPHLVAKAANQ
jgi:hypothetical protein